LLRGGSFLFGCTIPGTVKSKSADSKSNNEVVIDQPQRITGGGQLDNIPCAEYPYGINYLGSDKYSEILAEYNDWKDHYITSNGAGGFLRVQRDNASQYDTVSEGIGYGMLLAVYFNDKSTFDNLWNYCKLHWDTFGLMHWKVRADGVDVSEFGLALPHSTAYVLKSTALREDLAVNPNDRPVYDVDKAGNPDWLEASGSGRDLNSATDADIDIATALVMASKKWYISTFIDEGYYHIAAKNYIKAICDYEIEYKNSKYWLKAGDAWGGKSGWNPSYFAPGALRVIANFMNNMGESSYAEKLNSLISNMYSQMAIINASNNPAGLYPDWVDTSTGVSQKTYISDRKYYLDISGPNGKPDGILDNYDDQNGDKVFDSKDAVSLQSYNFYYDAVRVPWRMAVDYSWFGTSDAKTICQEMKDWYQSKIFNENLFDGYSITGGAWNPADRDGFNNKTKNGGTSKTSASFYAMCSTVGNPCSSSNINPKTYYAKVKKFKDSYSLDFNYFGNTLRLLSMLYISGYFTNIYDSGICLKAKSNSKWLRGLDDGFLVADSGLPDPGNTYFDLICNGNKIKLRWRYNNGEVYLDSSEYLMITSPGWGQEFELETTSTKNEIKLKAPNGKYVRVRTSNKRLIADTTSSSKATIFIITHVN